MLTTIETLQDLRQGSASIIYFSRYRADQVDNGGARRVAQLLQLLIGYDLEFVTSMTKPAASGVVSTKVDSLFNKVVRAVVRCRYRLYGAEFAIWIFFSRRLAKRWVRALARRDNIRLVIVDDPIFFAPLVQALHDRSIPVVAHCHNIETLSRSQVQSDYQKQLLAEELGLLSLCLAAITISREETFLLRNIGLNTFYLPYYPPLAIEQRLLAVRQLRTHTVKRDFLLLGSVGNVPTLIGIERVIAAWEMHWGGIHGDRLIVAGHGTEVLLASSREGVIEVAGSVTDEQLDGLLVRVRGCIVYQEDGAGALTRISELLLSGVPVIANTHAARSYYHLPGVIEFAEPADILSKLEELRSCEVKIVPPVLPNATNLLEKIHSLLQ
jgi:Glycosyltransferase Family 4